MILRLLPALLLLSGASLIAQATKLPEASIDGLNIGTHWYGPQVSKKDLLGKVTLVEIYGS